MHAFTEPLRESLTESFTNRSVSHSLGEWNGMEWKRNGREDLGSPSIHIDQLRNACDDERWRRFWSKVDFSQPDSCWRWMGEINHRGYGRFMFRGVRTVAHRVAYELAVGPIPQGLQCGHLCHVPACVRPDHLEPMTAKRNIAMRDERRAPAMTARQRQLRYLQRKRERAAAERLSTGWWVQI